MSSALCGMERRKPLARLPHRRLAAQFVQLQQQVGAFVGRTHACPPGIDVRSGRTRDRHQHGRRARFVGSRREVGQLCRWSPYENTRKFGDRRWNSVCSAGEHHRGNSLCRRVSRRTGLSLLIRLRGTSSSWSRSSKPSGSGSQDENTQPPSGAEGALRLLEPGRHQRPDAAGARAASRRWRAPTPRCCCAASRAPARSCSRTPSTTTRRAPSGRSSR